MSLPTAKTSTTGRAALAVAFTCALALLSTSTACGDDRLDDSIERAVKKGGQWLLAASPRPEYRQQGYPMGVEALALYALLHTGIDPDHGFIKERFEILRSLDPQQTYGVSLAILALDARHRSRAPFGKKPGPIRGGGRAQMQRMVDWLTANYAGGSGSWRYHRNHDSKPDFSNTQFAVLALAVAGRNGIGIDAGVFRDVGNNLVKRQAFESTTEIPIQITYRVTGDAKADARRPILPGRGKPGGWRYLSDDEFWGQKPTFSMTAAGCSCLLVSSHALRRGGQEPPVEFKKAARDGLIWLTKHLGDLHKFRGRSRGLYKDYFYALYSLEKVGDLAGILRFGKYEWYRREAQYLLKTQRGDGSWGSTKGMDRFVHTCLAVLFLKRATSLDDARNPVERGGEGAPKPYIAEARVIKSGGKVGDQAQLLERVFSDRLGKWVDVRTFFRFLSTTREAQEIEIAKDVFENTIPDEKPQLVPHLTTLLDGSSDAVERFARARLTSLTGLKGRDPREYAAWFERWRRIRAIGESRDKSKLRDALDTLADKSESMELRLTALWAIRRLRDRASLANLVALLERTPRELRKPLHTALCELSGESTPYDSREWLGIVEVWRSWAKVEGIRQTSKVEGPRAGTTTSRASRSKATRVDRETLALLEELELAESAREASEAVRALAARPPAEVVPAVLARMDSEDYSYYLIEVLERISGEKLGPSRRPWARWWATKR